MADGHLFGSLCEATTRPLPHPWHLLEWLGSMDSGTLLGPLLYRRRTCYKDAYAAKRNWICAYIGESGGHLQLIGYTKKDKLTACFDILEMQEIKSEWSVLYGIDLSQVKEMYPDIAKPTWDTCNHQQKIFDYLALSPIYVIRGTGKTGQDGVLIFSIPAKILSYSMEDQEILVVKEIARSGPLEEFWYSFYAYNPSLFAL